MTLERLDIVKAKLLEQKENVPRHLPKPAPPISPLDTPAKKSVNFEFPETPESDVKTAERLVNRLYKLCIPLYIRLKTTDSLVSDAELLRQLKCSALEYLREVNIPAVSYLPRYLLNPRKLSSANRQKFPKSASSLWKSLILHLSELISSLGYYNSVILV